ncbi:MAG: hypothetical protein M0Q53_16525 [Prolixibacteraceae bacterium]|jgi:hypothetical protein|nr:hypothetical protein [Prolixibacteraceae bacterium]
MKYKGRYEVFDPSQIKTYPVKGRNNKVKFGDLREIDEVLSSAIDLPEEVKKNIETLSKEIIERRTKGQPILLFTGGHLVKNGLNRLLVDLIHKGLFTIISGNGATSIHDFELALMGETSEYVPQALEKGEFGMAYEFNFINAALSVGNKNKLGYGESVGKMICKRSFRKKVAKYLGIEHEVINFTHPELSIAAACYEEKVPFTVHVGIGTDVLDQHYWFDGCAKGGCSGRDFLIYTQEVSKLMKGGVILNVGSAVTGPEVFLKAASMVGNVKQTPNDILTANFDLRQYKPETATNESAIGYYFRDQKSIVTRIPQAYGGKGFYIEGNQIQTIPYLYQQLIKLL